jgi:hypothetical protein
MESFGVYSSPFSVLASRFVFKFGAEFEVRGSEFGVRTAVPRAAPPEPSNLEPRTSEPRTANGERRT